MARADREGDFADYTRRILVNTYLSGQRSRRREHVMAAVPDQPAPERPTRPVPFLEADALIKITTAPEVAVPPNLLRQRRRPPRPPRAPPGGPAGSA